MDRDSNYRRQVRFDRFIPNKMDSDSSLDADMVWDKRSHKKMAAGNSAVIPVGNSPGNFSKQSVDAYMLATDESEDEFYSIPAKSSVHNASLNNNYGNQREHKDCCHRVQLHLTTFILSLAVIGLVWIYLHTDHSSTNQRLDDILTVFNDSLHRLKNESDQQYTELSRSLAYQWRFNVSQNYLHSLKEELKDSIQDLDWVKQDLLKVRNTVDLSIKTLTMRLTVLETRLDTLFGNYIQQMFSTNETLYWEQLPTDVNSGEPKAEDRSTMVNSAPPSPKTTLSSGGRG